MRYFRFNLKHFKRIPKRNVYLAIFLLALILYSLFCVLKPPKVLLQNSQEVLLKIDTIKLAGGKSRGTKQYTVTSNGQSYYFVYDYYSTEGKSEHTMFREWLDNRANKQNIVMVSIVSTEQTLSDILFNRHRILRITIDDTEYLSMEATENHMLNNYLGAWFGFGLFSICFLIHLLWNAIAYEIIKIR